MTNDPLFTDREWFEAKMFGQYEQRENREEVVVFSREDLAGYVSMIREYDAALVAAAEREACAKACEDVWNHRKGLETGTALECVVAIRARAE
jgi:hypothetical protein